ncbi:aspartate/glutamate racemase family protein [Pseudomonas sp. NY15354]|uniref:maleate cis-trans isomerase family protein n=1 Tax=Pseudomonas sp. NY15354 TaxID=3400351 RepID=UPI003A8530C8
MKHHKTGIDFNQPAQHRPRLGLIALASDVLVERDFWRMGLAAGIDIVTTRIAQSMPLTPATLARLEDGIPDAVRLLLPDAPLDAIVFACTSGSAIIGPQKVAEQIAALRPGVAITNPATAAVEALKHLGCRRIVFIAPYTEDVAEITSGVFAEAGIGFSDRLCFGLTSDVQIATPGLAHYRRAIAQADIATADAIFLSCTTAATLDLIAPLEAETGLPVITSNQAAFWHALRCMGHTPSMAGFGTLFSQPRHRPAAHRAGS